MEGERKRDTQRDNIEREGERKRDTQRDKE